VSTGFSEEHPWLHVDTRCAMKENIGKRNENVNANSERNIGTSRSDGIDPPYAFCSSPILLIPNKLIPMQCPDTVSHVHHFIARAKKIRLLHFD
jgi:hypothetical protein